MAHLSGMIYPSFQKDVSQYSPVYTLSINNLNLITLRYNVFQFRSPLLSKSLLIFIPLTTEMFHFVRFSFFILFLSGNFGLNGLLTYTNYFRFSHVPFYKLPRYPHRNLVCAFGSNKPSFLIKHYAYLSCFRYL